jgi:hypothetical protein
MKQVTTLSLLALLLGGCSNSSASGSVHPETSQPPAGGTSGVPIEATAPASPGASVAAVDMMGDCPAGSPGSAEADQAAGKARFAPPSCFDASISFEVMGQPDREQEFTVSAVRLKHETHEGALSELRTKDPQAWVDDAYKPWDGKLAAGKEAVVTYRLSAPDWRAVEKTLGIESSEGQMFVVEVDVQIDGETRTLTSPQFTRSFNDMVVT